MWSQQQFCLHPPHNGWLALNLAAEYTDHKYESSAPDLENLKDMKWRIMNWSMSIHTCNIASVIPVSTTPSATSTTPRVSASVHTKTQRICERKKLLIICTQLHSLNLTSLLAGVYIEKLIMEPPTSWRHDCLQGPPTLGAVVCTYNTPLGFEGRNVVINGSLLCNSGQHSHNMCQGYLELDTSCFRP